MSWGISFKAEIDILRVSKEDIESQIEDSNNLISMYDRNILQYAIATPIFTKAEEQNIWLHELGSEIADILENYKEQIILNYKLGLAKENIKSIKNT